jgi:hypothetical protein
MPGGGRDGEPDLWGLPLSSSALWKRNAGPMADVEPLPRRRRGAVVLLVVFGFFVCCEVFGALLTAGLFR